MQRELTNFVENGAVEGIGPNEFDELVRLLHWVDNTDTPLAHAVRLLGWRQRSSNEEIQVWILACEATQEAKQFTSHLVFSS